MDYSKAISGFIVDAVEKCCTAGPIDRATIWHLSEPFVLAIKDLYAFKDGFPRKEGYYDIKHKSTDSNQCFITLNGYFKGGSFYQDWDGDLIAIHNVVGWRETEGE